MNKKILIFSIAFLILSSLCFTTNAEITDGKYYTLLEIKSQKIIHKTAIKVHVGDEYITQDNSRYEVVKVEGYKAFCKYKGKEKMPEGKKTLSSSRKNAQNNIPVSAQNKPKIVLYHTHNGESYVPTDGTESIDGLGGIHDVGKEFAKKLEELGFDVTLSDNNHNPHDINAYHRSRKTATQLLKEGPEMIIDVHRDAVPPDVYKTELDGKEATQIKLVVGRSNPNMNTNLEFAKKIKSVMDEEKPGLSNGIFIGKGDFNQDLNPRAILIEVGAHTNSKEAAFVGISNFAEIVPSILDVDVSGGNEAAKKPLTQENQQGAWRTVLILLIVVVAGVGGFYLLNRGSVEK